MGRQGNSRRPKLFQYHCSNAHSAPNGTVIMRKIITQNQVSLVQPKEKPDLKDEWRDKKVLIWSGQWGAFWRPDSSGYTKFVDDAGLYTMEEALADTWHAGREKQISYIEASAFPKIVCLCGSTRFKEAFEKAMRDETLKGNIVLSVGLFGHLEGLDMSGDTKKMLDQLHLRKIDLADEVLILNVGGYIGESTKREEAYAKENKKSVRYLENPS